jgi:hypothetical protein
MMWQVPAKPCRKASLVFRDPENPLGTRDISVLEGRTGEAAQHLERAVDPATGMVGKLFHSRVFIIRPVKSKGARSAEPLQGSTTLPAGWM